MKKKISWLLVLLAVALVGVSVWQISRPSVAEQLQTMHKELKDGALEQRAYQKAWSAGAEIPRSKFKCDRVLNHLTKYANAVAKQPQQGGMDDYLDEITRLVRHSTDEEITCISVLKDIVKDE